MKSKKKKLKEKSKILLLSILIVLIPSGFVLTVSNFFNFPMRLNPTEDNSGEVKAENDGINPMASISDFDSATKVITKGSQQGTFDENNLRIDDGNLDSTDFEVGASFSYLKEDPTYWVGGNGVSWGTNGGGPGATWDIPNALRDPGSNNLWLKAQWGINYPAAAPGTGWVWMRWGGYSNLLDAKVHPHIYQIRIIYGIWVDYWIPTGLSQNLRLWAITNGTSPYVKIEMIDVNPGDAEYFFGVMTLNVTNAPLFMQSINKGGYVKDIAVDLDMAGEILPANAWTWINVDFIDIYYDFVKYDVDFTYQLDFGSYTITSITEFDVKIDVAGTKSGLNVYLYNFDTAQYDKILTFDTAATKIKKISINADDYFSVDQEVHIRFERENYYDINPYTSYFIQIDQVLIDIHKPDPPSNVQATSGILHIFLTWDIPNDYGVPLTHYNVYRGEIEGGSKDLIASPSTNEFNDTTGVPETRYYYTITAVNSIGESDNSTEVTGKSFNQPFVEWITPDEDATIIFGMGAVRFNFTYDYGFVDDVELVINGTGPYNVTGKSSITLIWSDLIKGRVNATLFGYNHTDLVSEDSRFFNFIRILFETVNVLEEKTKLIGQELYLILHDPNGDNSFSGFSDTTQFSIGVGVLITEGISGGTELVLEIDSDLFGLGTGASTRITKMPTEDNDFDFRLELLSSIGLTSYLESLDPDYIGPGYGDVYWGELWTFSYKIVADYRVYSNGTDRYENPKLFWGLIRETETFANDYNAPSNWQNQNPVHDNWNNVTWSSTLYLDGGTQYTNTIDISSTISRYTSFEIQTEEETRNLFPGFNESLIIEMSKRNYIEVGLPHIYEANYTIMDDDPSDKIAQMIGVDHRFGTAIFKTISNSSKTSDPLEYDTIDYIPPVIEIPDIDLDTNDDGYAPASDDSPLITVEIFDEGGISEAYINYSIDEGLNWNLISLHEQTAGTWTANIPAQQFNTTVLWYIIAKDNQGGKSTRLNTTGDPFEYTVISKPTITEAIPGFPIISIITIIIVVVVGITEIQNKKRFKYKN